MQPLTLLAGSVVALSALYLLGFGALAVAAPARAFVLWALAAGGAG